jgi:hypothetical protein
MSEIVFILGAGASVDSGAPLMGNFLERADRLHRQNLPDLDNQAFERVFQAISKLQAVHSKATLDLDNLETVFGALEMAKVIGLFPGMSREEIDALYASFKKLIAETLEESVQFKISGNQIRPSDSYSAFAELLSGLTRGHRSRTCSVITFNYDVALDYALQFHGVPFDYCLDAPARDQVLPFLKLHGSLNWVCAKGTNRIIPWPCTDWLKNRTVMFRDATTFKFRISHRLAAEHPSLGKDDYDPQPVIIPPTWNKTASQGNLANVWRQAAQELSDAQEIYVSGYSLIGTDTYFRYLFALGAVGPSRIRRFLVADPSQEVKVRFRELLGQDASRKLEYQKATFGEMVELARTNLLPRDSARIESW